MVDSSIKLVKKHLKVKHSMLEGRVTYPGTKGCDISKILRSDALKQLRLSASRFALRVEVYHSVPARSD